MNNKSLWLLLPFLLVIFFNDVLLFNKTFSTSSLVPGTTPSGPYGFSGRRPEMPFSFDTGGDAWVNEPNPYIIKKVLHESSFPAWNPLEGLGMPLVGNLNTEVFNPLKVFLNLSPNPFSQDMFFLLRLLVMGIFTYLFLREMELSPLSCLLGSSFFMLSGYSVWWINLHPLSTVTYLPAVFYFYEKWRNREHVMNAFLMSLFLSFAFVAGKIPDVLMGVSLLFIYATWKGFTNNSVKGLCREGCRAVIATLSGTLMAAVALAPFVELYSNASPLARAIRTGAAGHIIPMISSVSLVQPLFLGWKNYSYGSWLKWTPDAILPHAGIVMLLLVFCAAFNRKIVIRTLPYFVFSIGVFFVVYGILPSQVVSRLPVIRSIEFLKYNGMFYFSLAIISAYAFDDLLSAEGSRKRFYLSLVAASVSILVYFIFLYSASPAGMNDYMVSVLLLSLVGLLIMGLAFHFLKSKQLFGIAVFLFLVGELFLYMPKDHPDRGDPYKEPPYLKVIKDKEPYRITGDGSSLPPLVSGAMGLYDARAISVLMPGDYYRFFETLLGFSLPGTNNPNPLFTATSPFSDLVGTKYVMSREPLERSRIEAEVKSHIGALRVVRLFGAMINHAIEGGVTYGPFEAGGEKKFSLFFPLKFAFETRLRASEPFVFTGFALKDVPKGAEAKIKITIENRVAELNIREGVWKDQWFDISAYSGKVITIKIEGIGDGDGQMALGDFGLSPGHERERIIYDNLLTLHKKEFDFLKYRGAYEGIHIYENTNVMDRAFVLHRIKPVGNLNDVIRELQEGSDFRQIGLVTPPLSKAGNEEDLSPLPKGGGPDRVMIKKYASDEAVLEVESGGGLLVLSDLYYPGWKVRVDGKEARIIKAFGLLRGVGIGGGKVEVLFYYRPVSLYAGSIISVMTFAAWIAFFIISRRKDRLCRFVK
ncbi:MAG TPA: hypothetical protein VEI46_06290 [Thermodesulfovibrionales bacterium]|nr:hypothetical protein [Thermodesulfovibrionales bacterium]